ncbi:hypothetical protein D3Z36_01665 [Lachnospiraceae bacterium]|nr:hypothetical protein [Lachnospiraceae bacterium]
MKKLFETPRRAVISTVCITVIVIFFIGILLAVAFFAGFSYREKEYAQVREKERAVGEMQNENKLDPDFGGFDDDAAYGVGEGSVDEKLETGIGIEEAKSIAAGHAGCSVSEVDFSKTKLDNEHGRMVYEIEFYKDFVEYEYEIDAESGEIIKFDSEWDD